MRAEKIRVLNFINIFNLSPFGKEKGRRKRRESTEQLFVNCERRGGGGEGDRKRPVGDRVDQFTSLRVANDVDLRRKGKTGKRNGRIEFGRQLLEYETVSRNRRY